MDNLNLANNSKSSKNNPKQNGTSNDVQHDEAEDEEISAPHFDDDEKMYDSEEEAAKARLAKQEKDREGSPKLSKKEMRKQKKQEKLRSQYDAIINHGDGDQFTLAQQTDTYKGLCLVVAKDSLLNLLRSSKDGNYLQY